MTKIKHSISPLAEEYLGNQGISYASKGRYRYYHPGHLVFYNAVVSVRIEDSKGSHWEPIWRGDIDLTLHENKLDKLSTVLFVVVGISHEGAEDIACTWYLGKMLSNGIPKYYERNKEGRLMAKETEKVPVEYEYNSLDFDKLTPLDIGILENMEMPIDIETCFEGITKERSPLHLFYTQVEQVYGIKQEEASSCYVSREDFNLLEKLFSLWYQGFYPHDDEYAVHKNVSFSMFNWAPCHFETEKETWIEQGNLYRKNNKK